MLAEEYFSLNDMQEGQQRTETLLLKSMIKEKSVLQVKVTGAEVAPITYQVGLDYTRTRRY